MNFTQRRTGSVDSIYLYRTMLQEVILSHNVFIYKGLRYFFSVCIFVNGRNLSALSAVRDNALYFKYINRRNGFLRFSALSAVVMSKIPK